MQAIAPVTINQLLAAGQQPLIKLEIYVNTDWIEPWVNLCDTPTERDRQALTDGGLELWNDAEDLTDWTEFDSGGIAEGVFREAVIVHSGTFSAKIHTDAGGSFAGFYQDFTLTPGNACNLSLWYIKGAHASSQFRVYVFDTASNVSLKSDGTWQAGVLPLYMTDSAVWKLFELEFTSHASYSNYRLRLYKSHAAGGAISYYLDDISLIETVQLTLESGQFGNYLESAYVSLGGAAMTPNPVEGVWGASLFNQNGVFHPQHPTSEFKDWLQTERLARISVGATYGGVDYYWQRVIGYMDVPKFSMPDYRVAINGGDYMKNLRETELRSPNNYWGSTATFNSIASDGLSGVEIYAENDAMEIGGGEANNVANWGVTNCTFVSFADVGGGSAFVGRMIITADQPDPIAKNVNVGAGTAGTTYIVTFKYIRSVGSQPADFEIWQDSGGLQLLGVVYGLDSTAWEERTLSFTAVGNVAIQIWLRGVAIGDEFRWDQFSIQEFTPYWQRYYALPGASTGPYHVTLGGNDVWQGEGDEEWKYEEDAEAGPDPPAHPAKIVYFNINKVVANGVNNLIVSYFTQQVPENVVADLLVFAGLYADQATALTAMDYDATGLTIDMTWFKAGTTCLEAINKLCEFCDYRFYFDYDGTPVFKPKPAAGAAVFTFTDPKHIASINTYQDRNEIKNRIIIKGLKQSDTVGKEETMPSDLTGEASDATSIAAYGERTLTIDNHLFQTQAGIDAMCATLLAEYKDPKWYSDLRMPFNPVPLEMGDNIQWEERLSPTLNITQTGIIRDIKLDNFNTTYKCVQT